MLKQKNELRFNNDEFCHVEEHLTAKLQALESSMPEVKCFMDIFLDSCTTTLDKLSET